MFLEVLQGVGSAAGLVSAIYLGWQFVTRRMPVAVIIPKRPWEMSPTTTQFLRVRNPSDRPMIVRFQDNVGQNELRIMHNNSTRAAIEVAMGRSVELIIGAAEEREFRLARRADHDQIGSENSLQVLFYWRYAQPFLLHVERKCRVTIKKADYDALISDEGSRDDD